MKIQIPTQGNDEAEAPEQGLTARKRLRPAPSREVAAWLRAAPHLPAYKPGRSTGFHVRKDGDGNTCVNVVGSSWRSATPRADLLVEILASIEEGELWNARPHRPHPLADVELRVTLRQAGTVHP